MMNKKKRPPGKMNTGAGAVFIGICLREDVTFPAG